MPQNATTSTQPQTPVDGQRHCISAGSRPRIDCTISIQKPITTALSLRVSDFTKVSETAKPSAAPKATTCPRFSPSALGRTIRPTPSRPSTTASTFHAFMRSARKAAASSAVQIGIVNSIATTWPSGINVSAKNQPNCAP